MNSEDEKLSPEEEKKLLISILEQNWLHARHVENERLWFTNIYLIVVAGVLAYLSGSKFSLTDPSYRALLVFLLCFSALGLLATSKLTAEFGNHIGKIEKIFNERANGLKDYMGFPLNVGVWKYIKFRHVFKVFYLFTMILWLFLLTIPVMLS